MSLSLSHRDILYIALWFISVASIFFAQRNRLTLLERNIERFERIMLGDRGALNVIDQDACKEHRDRIFDLVRRNEQCTDKCFEEHRQHVNAIIQQNQDELKGVGKRLDQISDKITKIMIHQKIGNVDEYTSQA